MKTPGPWTALGAALTAQTAVSISEQGIPTITGFIKQDLSLSAGAAGALVAAVPAGRVIGSYAAGWAVDRAGERRVLVAGAGAVGLLVAASALVPWTALIMLLVLAGLFAGTPTPAGGKLVLLSFPGCRRGLAMGIRQTGVPLGGLAAALALPWLAATWDWRAALLTAGALTLVGGGTVFALAGAESGDGSRHAANATRDNERSLLRDRDILLLTLWGCMLVSGQYVLIAFLPVYLHQGVHISLTTATLFVALTQAGAITGRVLWGLLSDRLFNGRRRPLLLIITLIGCTAFALLSALPLATPLATFGLAAFLGGASVVGWQGIFIMSIGELAGPLRAGTATGFSLTFISVAIATAPPLYGHLADVGGGLGVMWAALAGVVGLALLPAFLVGEPSAKTMASE